MRPELLATRPNQLWSCDITKRLGPHKWTYYCLYVILDVFSRFVVGWMLALRKSATLVQHLIAETCRREAIAPGQLTRLPTRGFPERFVDARPRFRCGGGGGALRLRRVGEERAGARRRGDRGRSGRRSG